MNNRSKINSRFKLGLGTGHLREFSDCLETVKRGLELGYRHIDTARAYKNEAAIGAAVTQSEIKRESVFLATKIHSEQLGYQNVIESVTNSCDALDVETIDLVYVHWPAHAYEPTETIRALTTLQCKGAIQHIGLSNFTVDLIKEVVELLDNSIFAVQNEMHPYLQQTELHQYTNKNNIKLFAHTPLCQGEILNDPVLSSISEKYGINEAQITLAWLLQKDGVGAIVGTSGEHLKTNLATQSVRLDRRDIKRIEDISKSRRCVNYDFAPWNNTDTTS